MRRIRCTFRTARGRLRAEVAAAAAQADLLILAAVMRPLGRELRLELSVREIVAAAAGPVLLLHPERPPAGPVHVLIESPALALPAARAAAELARRYASPVVVTMRAPSPAERDRLLELVQPAFAAAPAGLTYRDLPEAGPATLGTLLATVASGTLVLEAGSPLLEPEIGWRRLAKASCTVVVVR